MMMSKDIDIRGSDVQVMSQFWCGPWHCILHGVYTKDGVLLGLFATYGEVIDFVLKARHRVINMRSLLLQAADECRRFRELSDFLNEP